MKYSTSENEKEALKEEKKFILSNKRPDEILRQMHLLNPIREFLRNRLTTENLESTLKNIYKSRSNLFHEGKPFVVNISGNQERLEQIMNWDNIKDSESIKKQQPKPKYHSNFQQFDRMILECMISLLDRLNK